MGKLVLLRANVGYDGPPPSVAALNPELAEYLWVLHNKLFGTSQSEGDQDLDTETLAVNHSIATNLAADDHPQYLNGTRHAAIGGNPHGVNATEVGNDVAQWNAAALQGNDISVTAPAEGEVLTWDSTSEHWEARPTGATGNFLTLELAEYTVTPAAGASAGQFVLPSQAMILGVFVENEGAFLTAPNGYQIGTEIARNAWGVNGPASGARNGIGFFSIGHPYYTTEFVEALYFTCVTGTFPGNVAISVRIYYWRQPAW